MNKVRILLCGMLLASTTSAMAQGAKNIRLNEVLTNNTASIVDEFGNREAWIEVENTSFTTYNIRGMYFTTDRSVLDPQMSVPERIKRMSVIPNGDPRTQIGGRQHLVFYCNSNPAEGKLHLSLPVPMSEPVWIGFYNGNAVELIDVPALAADQSYARHGNEWSVKSPENVTPGIENFIKTDETKDAKLKREDPYGVGITLLAMGIVFFCLAVLFVFFWIFGLIMRHMDTAKKVVNTHGYSQEGGQHPTYQADYQDGRGDPRHCPRYRKHPAGRFPEEGYRQGGLYRRHLYGTETVSGRCTRRRERYHHHQVTPDRMD